MCIRTSLLLTLAPVALAAVAHIPIMAQERNERIQLPSPRSASGMSVEEALQQRRSLREFARRPLTVEDVSQILWSAQGRTNRAGYRTAPSAGALFPLEVYLLIGDVTDLTPGLYRYRPSDHQLETLRRGDLRAALAAAAVGQEWIAHAPAAMIIAGVYERTAQRYGTRAPRYVHMEVGHAAQNVYLQASSLGLGTTFVGAFRDEEVRDVLDLPPDHVPLGVMPIGHHR